MILRYKSQSLFAAAAIAACIASTAFGQAMPRRAATNGPAQTRLTDFSQPSQDEPPPPPVEVDDSDSGYCECCDCCCSRWQADIEYLYFWGKGRQLPPLVTTTDPIPANRVDAGVLTNPDTTILFGNDEVGGEGHSGARVELKYLMDPCTGLHVGASYFALEDDNAGFNQATPGDPVLAVPFFDAQFNMERAILVGFPGFSSGSINIQDTQEVQGGDLYLQHMVYCCGNRRAYLRAGYDYYGIDNRLENQYLLTSEPPNGQLPFGTVIDARDLFDVENEFHGGSFGVVAEADNGRWGYSVNSKISFGNMYQQVSIRGAQLVTLPNGAQAVLPGGIFAQPTNIGDYERDRFAVVPELHLTAHYCVSPHIKATFGYSFVYWSDVAHAGEQIDRNVNLSQLSGNLMGTPAPLFRFVSTDDWIQGLRFGLSGTF